MEIKGRVTSSENRKNWALSSFTQTGSPQKLLTTEADGKVN